MANIHHFNTWIVAHPPIATGQIVSLQFGPRPLQNVGYNLPVEISTAANLRIPPLNAPFQSISVLGHFDTGASVTSIDRRLAEFLKLEAMGQMQLQTASGIDTVDTYVVDVSFINTSLRPVANLRVCSCNLNFDLEKAKTDLNNVTNFGMLIGRDLMSLWNITWHGPTSTVFISD